MHLCHLVRAGGGRGGSPLFWPDGNILDRSSPRQEPPVSALRSTESTMCGPLDTGPPARQHRTPRDSHNAHCCMEPAGSEPSTDRMLAAGPIPVNSTSVPFRMPVARLLSILQAPRAPPGKSPGGRVGKVAVTPATLMLHACDERRQQPDSDWWLHHVRLASNCWEQNLVAVPWPGPVPPGPGTGYPVVLVATRHILPGEELSFWPSFSLWLLMLGAVPFLSPANIDLTDERYVCHRCGNWFRQPNPLKIHLVLACPVSGGGAVSDTAAGSAASNSSPGAGDRGRPSPARKRSSAAHLLPRRLHTCSYCGKVYTRKYGLKIHIRTHTGSKPLSCRYCGRSFSDPSNLNKHLRLHTQQQQQQQQQQQHPANSTRPVVPV